jgi:hypothetical protein
MTLFRHTNGLLYTLEMVRRPRYTEASRLVATPYKHQIEIKNPCMQDFIAVAHR